MTAQKEVQIADNPEALARLAADIVSGVANEAIQDRGSFHIALSGGSTPKALFHLFAGDDYRDHVDWTCWQIFFSDERFVPPESSDSNYHMARESLLSRVNIPSDHVHAVPTIGVLPEESAAQYERTIRHVIPGANESVPQFDVILLGLGPDGHTASLFPGTKALSVDDKLVAANFVPAVEMWRITFTYPLINAARVVAFLVQGEDKAERAREVLTHSDDLPAAGVQPTDGRLLWLLDRASASLLAGGTKAD